MNRNSAVALALVFVGAMCFATAGQATFEGLGVLPGFESSYAASVSADGTVVVGAADNNFPLRGITGAFRWTSEDGIEALEYLFPGGDPGQTHYPRTIPERAGD